MAPAIRLQAYMVVLTPDEERRLRRHLQVLEKVSVPFPITLITVLLTPHTAEMRIRAELRVQFATPRVSLTSSCEAETASSAVSAAVDDLRRQLVHLAAGRQGDQA